MVITNFSNTAYVLDRIEATAGASRFSFSGGALEGMIVHLGASDAKAGSTSRAITAGRSLIIFFLLDLGRDAAPRIIEHTLDVIGADGGAGVITVAPLAVSAENPILIAPPLRGLWMAADAVNNGADAAHRKAVLVIDGRAWLAQRYAIDWVQIQKVGASYTTWKGAEGNNESYFCYDQPIYSVAPGKVVGVVDGLPENVPHSGKYAVELSVDTAGGNHVVVEIAPQRYVLYAHMKTGTVRVKVGDAVGVGDVLGHVGNSGSSTEPHLHMHVVDQPSFLAGNGIPYEFRAFEATGPVETTMSSSGAVNIGPIGPQKPFINDYPANNAEVTFR